MANLASKTNISKQVQKKRVIEHIRQDACDLFSGNKTGHVGYMRYGAPLYEGDKVLGAQFWYNSQQSEDYYLIREEKNLLKRILHDSIFEQDLEFERFVDYGPGDIYAVAAKAIPLMNKIQAKEYVALDMCENYAKDAAICIATSCKKHASYNVVNFFTKDVSIGVSKSFLFMAGSTIANIPIDIRVKDSFLHLSAFFGRARKSVTAGSWFLIGYDANNDEESLLRSYNNPPDVARFYENALWMIERDTDYQFDPAAFAYKGCWIAEEHRFAHYLVAQTDCQIVSSNGESYHFYKDAALHIDNSYKFPPEMVQRAAANAGWKTKKLWTETGRVHYILLEAI